MTLINRTLTSSYSTSSPQGRKTGIGISGAYSASYGYDGFGRLNNIAGPGLPTGGVWYSFAEYSDLVELTQYVNGGSLVAQGGRGFEMHRDLIEIVENSSPNWLGSHVYQNDILGRRELITRYNTYPPPYSADCDLNEYNRRDEVVKMTRFQDCDPGTPTTQCAFDYDLIGNRLWSQSNGGTHLDYVSNNLNQYTSTKISGTTQEQFAYDLDGNLSQDGAFNYFWDAENRLVAVEPKVLNASSKRIEYSYDYLGRRWRKRVLPRSGSGWGSATLDHKFIYDGWNVIMELDGLSGDSIVRKLTWGLDLSGQNGNPSVSGIHGAGGVGGLLAVAEPLMELGEPMPEGGMMMVEQAGGGMAVLDQQGIATSQPDGGIAMSFADTQGNSAEVTLDAPDAPQVGEVAFTPTSGQSATLGLQDADATTDGLALSFGDGGGNSAEAIIFLPPPQPLEKNYWFFYDANGNVTDVLDSATGNIAAHYEYEPYGKVLLASGPYAQTNSIRFSTKWWDSETGQGYWGMRFLSSDRGRWIGRDPVEESGGLNLYAYATNAPTTEVDVLGLFKPWYHGEITKAAFRKLSWCKIDSWDLKYIMEENAYTDVKHPLNANYHAQIATFPWYLRALGNEMRRWDCCNGARLSFLGIGTMLHIIQDFYSHTDWIEGNSQFMIAAYIYNGDRWVVGQPLNAPHGPYDTLNVKQLMMGSMEQLSGVFFYSHGLNPWNDSWHNLYAVDEPDFGRGRAPPEGLGGGAWERARFAAEKTSVDLLRWALKSMHPSCRKSICKQ